MNIQFFNTQETDKNVNMVITGLKQQSLDITLRILWGLSTKQSMKNFDEKSLYIGTEVQNISYSLLMILEEGRYVY